MSYPNAKILSLDEGGVHAIEYEDTEHFAVMKQFMSNHKKLLRILMEVETPSRDNDSSCHGSP